MRRCGGDAVEMQMRSSGDTVEMQRRCSGDAAEMRWRCGEDSYYLLAMRVPWRVLPYYLTTRRIRFLLTGEYCVQAWRVLLAMASTLAGDSSGDSSRKKPRCDSTSLRMRST